MSSDLYLEDNEKALCTFPDKMVLDLSDINHERNSSISSETSKHILEALAIPNPLLGVTVEWKSTSVILKGNDASVLSFLINRGLLSVKENKVYVYSWVNFPVSALNLLINV